MRNVIKVLLTDEHDDVTTQLVSELQSFGFEVTLCGKNGDELIKCVERIKPDIVIMDAFLHRLDALGVLSRLSVPDSADKPLIFVLSGTDNTNLEKLIMRNGADYYFLKPVDAKMVAERVVQLVCWNGIAVSLKSDPADDLITTISGILHRIGVTSNVKGYLYLRSAIYLAVENPHMISSATKVLYPNVAKEYSTSPHNVERAIRYAIEIAWNRGNRDIINAYFGDTLSRKKPTNTQFIATITDSILLRKYIR